MTEDARAALVARLAEDIDFAIDVTEPRDVRLRRFQTLIEIALGGAVAVRLDGAGQRDGAEVVTDLTDEGLRKWADGLAYNILDYMDVAIASDAILACLVAVRDAARRDVLTDLAAQIATEPEGDTRRCDEIRDWLLFHARVAAPPEPGEGQ